MKRAVKHQGPGAFEDYYGELYGERWPSLRAALLGPSRGLALRVKPEGGLETRPADPQEPEPQAGAYYLDGASVAAASALSLPEAGQILDACAAPGGKSLVLAARMGQACHLVCNELSVDRRRRLGLVLDSCLPPAIRSRVSVLGADASSLCLRRPGAFQAILLDAPCSSERHVLADPQALAEWSPNRPASLARRQWALLSSAFLMLAPGASLVYSTCSINPGENDGVAQRLLDKRGGDLVLDRPDLAGAEATGLGSLILPDRAGGGGPMYVFRIRRLG